MSTSSTRKRGFHFFTGDVNYLDYGGVWMRRTGPGRYHFIELINMDEACDNEGRPRYMMELSEVDLDAIPHQEIQAALQSCGLEDRRASDLAPDELAECVRSYGVRSPLHEESTNNARAGIAACRKESYRLTRDPDAWESALDRPVNRVGSTAREVGRGDLFSAVIRGAREGNADARIMAKMYSAADGQTLGGRVPEGELSAMRAALKGEGESS